jgi:hypothetical protein
MANNFWQWCRGASGGLSLLAVAGCGNFQAPQLGALKRDLDVDPTVRVRAYDSCKSRSHTTDDLDTCMKDEGYRFVSQTSQDYRASECWSDRYAGTFPKAYCYDVSADK